MVQDQQDFQDEQDFYACWFDQGVIGHRIFSNDKNPVNPV